MTAKSIMKRSISMKKHKEKINENAYETSRKYFDAEKNYNDFYDEILNLN